MWTLGLSLYPYVNLWGSEQQIVFFIKGSICTYRAGVLGIGKEHHTVN